MMPHIIWWSMVSFINLLAIFLRIFLIPNSSRKHKNLHFHFLLPFLVLTWVTARYLWHGECQWECEKGLTHVVQRVQTLLASKDEIAADALFSICIEHHSKTRSRDLGFISVIFTNYLLAFDNFKNFQRVPLNLWKYV